MAIQADKGTSKTKLAVTELRARKALITEQAQMGNESAGSLSPRKNNDLVRKDYVDSRLPNAAERWFLSMLNG